MSKNTGDGELKKILIDYLGTAWRAYEDGLIDPAPLSKAKTAIKKWAAQEANKAIIKKLESVMVKVDYTDSDTLITQKALRTHNNIQRELAQLKKEKESSDG